MIIYHARPFRFYPDIVRQIQKKYPNNYQFHSPIEKTMRLSVDPIGVENYDYDTKIPRRAFFCAPETITGFSNNNVNRIRINKLNNGLSSYRNFINPYNIDFLFGIFPQRRIDNISKDFIFTIIGEPIQSFYNSCLYMELCYKKPSLHRLCRMDIFERGIECGIDFFIEHKGFYFGENYCYKMIPETYSNGDLSKFNFIGTQEKLNRSLSLLSHRLRLNQIDISRNSSLLKTINYRKKDIEEIFKEDIEKYNLINNMI